MAAASLLLRNLLSLSALQLANGLISFLVIPYLIRTIGLANWGIINTAQALVLYFALLVNFGFDLTATRQVALRRNDPQALSALTGEVITVKGLLFATGTLLFGALVYLTPEYRAHDTVFWLTYAICFGYVFYPSWLFQGMENLRPFAAFNFVIKILSYGLVFVVIRTPGQYYLFPLLASSAHILVGIVACVYALRRYSLRLSLPSWVSIGQVLQRDQTVFFTMLVNNLAVGVNVLILARFAADAEVGAFTTVWRLVFLLLNLVNTPVIQTFFPNLTQTLQRSVSEGFLKIKQLSLLMLIVGVLISSLLFLFPSLILKIVIGPEYAAAVLSLRVLAFVIVFNGLGQIWLVHGLLGLRKDRYHSLIIRFSSVVGFALNYFLLKFFGWGSEATALSWLVTEILLAGLSYLILLRSYGNPLDFTLLPSIISLLKRTLLAKFASGHEH